jgi:hypothetical protein
MAKGNGFRFSQYDYAKHRGISQPAVAKMIRQGKLAGAWKKDGRKYLINPDKADAILETFKNPARPGKPGKPPAVPAVLDDREPGPAPSVVAGLMTFAEAARREKIARAALLELELQTKKGELVEKSAVEAVAAKIATTVRSGVEAIPARVAPTVAGYSAPGDVARYLQRELKAVLSDLSKAIEKMDL